MYIMSETEPLTTMIEYNDVLDMLGLTLLIYDYGKSIDYVKGDTLENFVSRMNSQANDISDVKRNVITNLANNISDGEIKDFISDPDTDLQAGITMSNEKKRITIIFRGSESTYDWYYDLNFLKTCINKDKNVYVHGGFHKQLTKNDNHIQLITIVKNLLLENPDYSVHVCGHSLGGALSTLFGYLLAQEISQIVTVISFASPRVGNYDWKKSFDETKNLLHFRVTNCNDIVTAFPSILYYHVGDNIRLEKNDKATLFFNDSYSWWDYTIFKCYSPGDHSCSEYYKHLSINKW